MLKLCCFVFVFITFVALVSAQCNTSQFKCRDGTCVDKNKQCNGLPDCKDWSDETLTACRGIFRPIWNLVVACVSDRVRALLDDVCPAGCAANPIDCGLNLLTVGVQRPQSNHVTPSCSYNMSIPNGQISLNGEIDVVNMTASHGSNLHFSCKPRYDLVGKSKVFCQFGQWSDEFPKCVRSNRDRCILPPFPRHGDYRIPNMENIRPGNHYENVNLYFTCNDGYKLLGGNTVVCNQGIWSSDIPTCQKLCKLNPHVSVDYFCDIIENNMTFGSRPCGQYEPEGTVVRPQCRSPNYYHIGMLNFMHCIDGNWDYVAVCDPECGKVTPSADHLGINGRNAIQGELPWHAGIYDKEVTPYMQICGGSLVSTTMVISAAHCFWKDEEKRLFPLSKFAVALGKVYRPWNNTHDTGAQKFNVYDIKITPRFRGAETQYQEDIALVILDRPAMYINNVRPVCLDFDVNFDRRQLEDGKKGKIAGWGLTSETNKKSNAKILQVLELPKVSIASCFENTPEDFRQFITSDRFCAGYWNGTQALCKGDSGGGLVFAEPERSSMRYYLRGVTSTAPRNNATAGVCEAHTVSTFTQISRHEAFIKQYLLL